jgi:hypothetical protein
MVQHSLVACITPTVSPLPAASWSPLLSSPRQVERLVCGNPNLDFEALERNSKYEGGFSVATAAVQWLWQVSERGEGARAVLCCGVVCWAVSGGCIQGDGATARPRILHNGTLNFSRLLQTPAAMLQSG